MPKRIRLGRTTIAREGLADISEQDRFRHLYIIGGSQAGKSTFLCHLVDFDHANIILDPAGNFARSVLALSPQERTTLVDTSHPLVVNPLDRDLPWENRAVELAEVINAVVRATTSSQDATALHKELIYQALRVMKKTNIEELANFLNFEQVRQRYHPDQFWEFFDARERNVWLNKEKVDGAKRVAARLAPLYISPSFRRYVIGKDQLDIKDIALKRKIIIFDLHGFSNDEMIYLGNLVVQAVKSYYNHATTSSPPLFLYVDEFHKFATPFFDDLLSQAAKYNVSINLAHQTHKQIESATLNAILGNCYTKVVFGCGYDEADKMAKEFGLKASDLQNIPKHNAVVRIGNKNHHIKCYPPRIPVEPEYYFLSLDWIKC